MLRTSQRQRQTGASESQTRRLRTWSRFSRGEGGGVLGGGGLCEGVSGGVHPRRIFRFQPAGFSGGFFWRIFLLYFCDQKKIHRKIHHKIHRSVESSCFRNPPALRHQKFTGLPPPPRESKSNSCAFGSGTVTFQGGSFQEKTPGLIGPRSLRILIGRIAVGWPCMECHVPCPY